MSVMEIVQKFYECFHADDYDSLYSLIDDDICFRLVGPKLIPYFDEYHGKAGVAEFVQRLSNSEDLDYFEPLEFLPGEDHVTVLGRERCVSKKTGKGFETQWAHVFFVKHEKIAKFIEYIDTFPMVRAYEG
jgi:ketosteroid isomerase-like protein